MRFLFLILFFGLSTHFIFGQIAYAKKYTSLVGQSCKLRTDGGCEIYHYKTLVFNNKGKVEIISESKFSCSPIEIEKTYNEENKPTIAKTTYQIRNNKMYIKNYQYSPLAIGEKELIYNDIIFKLEK